MNRIKPVTVSVSDEVIMLGMWLNDKNKVPYEATGLAINATNNSDGQVMVIYKNVDGLEFVREVHEFKNKFTKL